MSPLRRLSAVSVVALAVVGLAGCTTTKTVCENGECTVSFGGGKGDTDLSTSSGRDVTLEWTGTEDGTATISLGGEQGTCTEGASVSLAGAQVTCTKVTGDDLELTVS